MANNTEEHPLKQAQEASTLAQTKTAQGSFSEASEYHEHAAHFYKEATKVTKNAEVIRTLWLLHNDHKKQAKICFRARSAEDLPLSLSSSRAHLQGSFKALHHRNLQSQSAHRPAPSGIVTDLALMRGHPSDPSEKISSISGSSTAHRRTDSGKHPIPTPLKTLSEKPQDVDPVPDVSKTGAPLKGFKRPEKSKAAPEEAFERIWSVVENTLSKIAGPLNASDKSVPSTPSGDSYESEGLQSVKAPNPVPPKSGPPSESFYIVPSDAGLSKQRKQATNNNTQHRVSSKSLEEYSLENQQLKLVVDRLSRKLASFEKNAQNHNQMVYSSMVQLRKNLSEQFAGHDTTGLEETNDSNGSKS